MQYNANFHQQCYHAHCRNSRRKRQRWKMRSRSWKNVRNSRLIKAILKINFSYFYLLFSTQSSGWKEHANEGRKGEMIHKTVNNIISIIPFFHNRTKLRKNWKPNPPRVVTCRLDFKRSTRPRQIFNRNWKTFKNDSLKRRKLDNSLPSPRRRLNKNFKGLR